MRGKKLLTNRKSISCCACNKIIKKAYPLGPASPSPATLNILPELTPGGILTLIFFLTRRRPFPLHLPQYSDMTSPSPPQFGHTET